jgi:hypothetical protein
MCDQLISKLKSEFCKQKKFYLKEIFCLKHKTKELEKQQFAKSSRLQFEEWKQQY